MIRRLLLGLVLGAALGAGRSAEAQVSPGPLARAHAELEGALKCTKCHGGGGADAMPARCLACHRDVAWLAERNRGFHGAARVKAQRCAACHPDHAGVDFQLVKWPEGSAERFDHRRAGWALEQSHGKLACEKCHKPASRASPAAALAAGGKSKWTGLEQTCTACHEDIHRGALGARCASCHDVGKWTVTPGFNHDTTAYPLTGRHRETKCDQCHLDRRLGLRADAAGKLIPVYKPVPHATCTACHKDVHAGRFGANCSSCHSTDAFKTITPNGFDHGRTHFPLKGRHGAVKCAACHKDFTTEAGRRPAAGTCAACHADAHAGAGTIQGRPADCAACHTESGFTPSTFPLESHQKTRFALDGKHATAKCAACHVKDPTAPVARLGTARVVMRPAFERCQTCHPDDHAGQLAGRPDRGDCAACHRSAGWKPSRIDRAAHAELGLALDGRHGEVACRACHGPERAGLRPLPARAGGFGKSAFVFKGVETACVGCHVDPHGGRFEPKGARPIAGGCLGCHGLAAFRPAAVDVVVHQGFRLKLDGAHRATPCGACHKDLDRPRAAVARASSLVLGGTRWPEVRIEAPLTCAECHRTVHGSQFDGRKGGAGCEQCHTEDAFAPAARFDHDRDATFALKGGHQKVACSACHKTEPVPGGPARVIYRPLSGKCENCHTAK